jgi:hypothetical protein
MDIEDISEVRKGNLGVAMAIGFTPGFIAGLSAYTLLPEGDEKASRIFYLGEIIGLSISGTIAAMKSVDYDYVFTDLSLEQKQDRVDKFIKGGLRIESKVRVSPWIGIYNFPNQLRSNIIFPGMRFSVCFSPRHRMEFMYGFSKWRTESGGITTRDYYDIKEYRNFNLLRIGLRTDLTYHKNFNPFIAWGWGLFGKQYKLLNTYDGYLSYYGEEEKDIDIILCMDFGLEHHFNRWISLESRVSVVENIDYGLHFMGQVGLQIGKFY